MWHYILNYEGKECCNAVFFSFSVPIDGETTGPYVNLYLNWSEPTLQSGR